jgi:hypothetical protein
MEWLRQIAEGLRVLHEAGILHRNLHPEAILVDPESGIRLSSFGLEERWESCEAEQVAFLAPEQAAYGLTHETSDLYSLGAIAFLLLTGHPPLERTSPLATAVAHVRERAPRVDSMRPDVPKWLAAIVAKLLDRDENARYQSASEFLDDLRAHRTPRRTVAPKYKAAALLGSAALATVIAAMIPQAPWNQPKVAVLAADPRGGIVVSDRTGLVLWRRPDILLPGRAVLIEDGPSGDAEVAAIVGAGAIKPGITMLSYLEGRTGTEIRRIPLPAPKPGLGNGLRVSIQSFPPGKTRGTLVTVTFQESGAAGSWTLVHDLVDPEAALVYQSSSPHRVLGRLDLARNGSEDLVLGGNAPWMGGYYGLAALPLGSPFSVFAPPELRPDRIARPLAPVYALLPAIREASIDLTRTAVSFETWLGRLRLLGDAAFPRDRIGASPLALRSSLRERAYELALRARDLSQDSLRQEASSRLREARDCAESAGDPYLLEWISRAALAVEGSSLSPADLNSRYEDLFRVSEAPVLTGLDAASAFHEAGDTQRAHGWYVDVLRSIKSHAPRSATNALVTGLLFLEAEAGGAGSVNLTADRLLAMFPEAFAEVEAGRRHVERLEKRFEKDPDGLRRERRRTLASAGSMPALFASRRP